jgi:NADH-quinone oxidoreductase subunit L
MDTSLALLLLFIGFLFNVFFGKSIGKSASGIIGTLLFSFRLLMHLFSPNKSNLKNPNFTLIGFKSAISSRFWFSIRPIIHFMVTFVTGIGSNSYVLYQLHA